MNKSIFERIFPHAPGNVLPQYSDQDDLLRSSRVATPPNRILLTDESVRQSTKSSSPSSPRISLKAAPLSASIIHHDDPFLPVERAAKALERNIQAFLDAQSEGLTASIGAGDDLSSVGSPTPTPSIATPTRSHTGLKVVPIRQPSTGKVTLRGARKGLARAMEDFAHLREEELRIIDAESTSRHSALQQTNKFQDKKLSLEAEITAIGNEDATTGAASLREEASKVEAEMRELENKLFELRTRHRQLTTQAEQLENSVDSKLSSYKSSLALIDRDVKQFLRTPPVSSALSFSGDTGSTRGGIYALNPDRRTLQLAQEQWSTEQNSLALRRADVEDEQRALQEGAKLWRDVVQEIAAYERELGRALKNTGHQSNGPNGEPDPTKTLFDKITDLISIVCTALTTAERNEWNLLICALGAELDALQQGRILLGGDPAPPPALERIETNGTNSDNDPPPDLLNDSAIHRSNSSQSLQDTLREFGNGAADKGKSPVRDSVNESQGSSRQDEDPWAHTIGTPLTGGDAGAAATSSHRDYRSESEDDDPGPDFLVEHSWPKTS